MPRLSRESYRMNKLEFAEKFIEAKFELTKLPGWPSQSLYKKSYRYLKDPEVIAYLDKARADIRNRIADNYSRKLHKLQLVAERSITDDGSPPMEGYAVGDGIRAIQEANRMEGHLAAEKHAHVNINADVDIQRLEEIVQICLKEF